MELDEYILRQLKDSEELMNFFRSLRKLAMNSGAPNVEALESFMDSYEKATVIYGLIQYRNTCFERNDETMENLENSLRKTIQGYRGFIINRFLMKK